ncbi:MAG: HD domain-containing phosphohydrolase [Pseudomonadota bacterium]
MRVACQRNALASFSSKSDAANPLDSKGITLNRDEPYRIKLNIRSFRIKVMMSLILSMLILIAVSGFLLNKAAIDGQLNQLRNQLMTVAPIAALSVDAELLKQIPPDREGVNTVPYKRVEKHLQEILRANAAMNDIYILTKTDQEGILQFIVDIETPRTTKGRPKAAYPGYRYNAARFPQMLKGYDGPSADEHFEMDEWGGALSGYAPIRDDLGETIAVMGVDIAADLLLETARDIHRKIWLILIIGLLASIFLGLWLSARISQPVTKLAEGTRHIASGDLQYRVKIKGGDEIGQLAQTFNRMAESLLESRKKLNDYFIQIVQSLALSLEAKDAYTGGHSVRVAEYAEQIATRIGLSKEKVAALKEATLLHDIGKLGISENILNKKEPLTLQEWEDIKSHPAVGGKILKPVCLNEDILSVITGHHERYDGTGYPNDLAGENISIYARIAAVADTYDAITSSRAYRPDMGKEWAISELEKSRGTQLDPRLVDVFIEILREDSPNTTLVRMT